MTPALWRIALLLYDPQRLSPEKVSDVVGDVEDLGVRLVPVAVPGLEGVVRVVAL